MADPLSIVTSIITLSNTLRVFAKLISDYTSADATVRDIRSTCELADFVLNNIKEQLDANILPTLLESDNSSGSGSPTGTRSTGVDLADALRNNVSQLQLDVSVVVDEVKTLFDPQRHASRVGEWKSSGVVVWKKNYLESMHARIQSKLTQLQLVQHNLTAQANNVVLYRQHSSPERVIESLGHIFRSPSQRRPSSDPYARQKLIKAVKEGDGDEAEKLLQHVDPNFASDDQEALFPLHYAARNADEPMIMLLLDHGARVDCSHGKPSPLILALENTDVAPALTLISRGAHVYQADPRDPRQTPLHISARRNHYHIVQVLLGCNVNLNVRDMDGHTPLFECVRSELRHLVPGDVGVLRILLDRETMGTRANPVLGRYDNNFNPLHLASQMGYVEDLRLLLEATRALGIDPDSATAWDTQGRSAIWYAASEGQVEAIKLLIRFGANVNRHFENDLERPTTLWAMATCGGVEDKTAGVLALLNAGANPNLGRNPQGRTLLAALCEWGDVSLVSILLSNGADPRIADHEGMQPLHHAAKNGDQETASLLLRCESHRVDINCRDNSGATPLIYAAMNGNNDHVEGQQQVLVEYLTSLPDHPKKMQTWDISSTTLQTHGDEDMEDPGNTQEEVLSERSDEELELEENPDKEDERPSTTADLDEVKEFIRSGPPLINFKERLRRFVSPLFNEEELDNQQAGDVKTGDGGGMKEDSAGANLAQRLMEPPASPQNVPGSIDRERDILVVYPKPTDAAREKVSNTTSKTTENDPHLGAPVVSPADDLRLETEEEDPVKTCTSARPQPPTYPATLPEMLDFLSERMSLSRTSEPPIPSGHSRIRWSCECGAQLFDDFIELEQGALQELQATLQKRPTQEQARTRNNKAKGADWSLLVAAESFKSGIAWLGWRASSFLTQKGDESNLPVYHATSTSTNSSAMSSSTTNNPPPPPISFTPPLDLLRLLFCIQAGETGSKLHQEKLLGIRSDREVLQFLRAEYYRHRKVTSWVTLRNVSTVSLSRFMVDASSFAQVHRHDHFCNTADCVCLPPIERIGTEYACRPAPRTKPKNFPAIGPNYLTHYFNHPECLRPTQMFIYNQLPKRACGQLSAPDDQIEFGWGVYLEEGWHWRSIYLIVVLLLVSGSLVFGVAWSVTKGDVQGGFAITSAWMTIGSLLLGYVAIKSVS